MIRISRGAAALWPLLVAVTFAGTPAFSQGPTDAQRNAIRSECRSDYEAHCSSIPPGGEASLQCLQKNMSSLAAVGGGGTPAAGGAPATAATASPGVAPAAAPAAPPVLALRPMRPREVLFV